MSDTGEPQKTSPILRASDLAVTAGHGKSSAKREVNHPYLDVPLRNSFTRSSDSISLTSTYSADNSNERCTGRLHNASVSSRSPSSTWKGKCQAFWTANKGLALVILSQLFGMMMNVTIRLLEMDGRHGPGMHPFQVRSALYFPM